MREQAAQAARMPLGAWLVSRGSLTEQQLARALEIQRAQGGRLGELCVDLGFVSAADMEEAIAAWPREKQRLGERLVARGLITPGQLDEALEMQRRSGGMLGDILLFMRVVSREDLYREIATQGEMSRFGDDADPLEARALPYEMARRLGAIVLKETDARALVAVERKLSPEAEAEIAAWLGKPVTQALVSGAENLAFWEKVYHQSETHESVFGLYEEQADNSAIVTFSSGQRVAFLAALAALIVALSVSWRQTLIAANVFIQIIYFLMTALKFLIVFKGEANNVQMRYTDEEVAAIDEKDLPVYTVLVPVYKEKEVVSRLMQNIATLDYPQHKLDVRVLLEADDRETIDIVRSMDLPFNFTPIVVPSSTPKTKPKACNYGLLTARGEFVVIYDAEDQPERDQLKKAYLAFRDLPEEYVCVQAKLNYFNSAHNALTKLFTQEYSMWFELLLVGIMQTDVPIPLGGTSNHFRMNFLKKVGGWDPFNVTEDADLGIRLYKFRYKTAILDSRTWEEANSHLPNWIRQRSRWIKGYMQTWLVHMRSPVRFFRSVGLRGFIGYQAMILGTPLLPLINPLFWAMLLIWFMTRASWINEMFPGALYYIATAQFALGNFAFMYMNIIGMYRVIRDCAVKGRQPFSYGLIKYALLTPLYWAAMSVAAYKALFQLIKNPHYWEKTDHGLTNAPVEKNENPGAAA